MYYWGAAEVNEDEDSLQVHDTMNRMDTLDLVEEMLVGKVWDDWIANERAK